MTFPKRISVFQENAAGEGFWKELCLVYDNEALGLLERKLFDWSIKVTDVAPGPHFSGMNERQEAQRLRREACDKQSSDDLAASGGIVDAP